MKRKAETQGFFQEKRQKTETESNLQSALDAFIGNNMTTVSIANSHPGKRAL